MVVQELFCVNQRPEEILQGGLAIALLGPDEAQRYLQLVWVWEAADGGQVQLVHDIQVAAAGLDEGCHPAFGSAQLAVQVAAVDQVQRLRQVGPGIPLAGAEDLPLRAAEYLEEV